MRVLFGQRPGTCPRRRRWALLTLYSRHVASSVYRIRLFRHNSAGAPDWPDRDRYWQIIEDNAVSIFYTAPTAIRAFMRWGEQYPQSHDLSSLRLLGSVGEPIN